MVQVYRREENGESEKVFRLFGLDADTTYRLEDFDGSVSEASGAVLMAEGLTVRAPETRQGKVILISRQ